MAQNEVPTNIDQNQINQTQQMANQALNSQLDIAQMKRQRSKHQEETEDFS